MSSPATVTNDARLDAMVRAIADGVRPHRIILFGSRARGDHRADSDYDLVVELEFEWTWDQHVQAHGRVMDVLRPAEEGASVDVLLRRPGDIERRRDDPGYLDWDIAREGIILYPHGADSANLRPAIPRSSQVRESEPFESIQDWLRLIDEDLRMIQLVLNAGEQGAWGAAGFHAQQAAEKYLKILLVQRRIHPPKTHRLDRLIARVHEAGYDFPEFDLECRMLNPYAVRIRYPQKAILPTEQKARAAVEAARRIIDAAKARM